LNLKNFVVGVAFILSMTSISAASTPVAVSRVSRYASISNTPSVAQLNPLKATSSYHFSSKATTVGDAVAQVLLPTGYSLSPELNAEAQSILKLPLPFTNKHLGPISAEQALSVLMGAEVFSIKRDPLKRTIDFKLKNLKKIKHNHKRGGA
jgi:conjugative transfer region protein (TIGR03748 family)